MDAQEMAEVLAAHADREREINERRDVHRRSWGRIKLMLTLTGLALAGVLVFFVVQSADRDAHPFGHEPPLVRVVP